MVVHAAAFGDDLAYSIHVNRTDITQLFYLVDATADDLRMAKNRSDLEKARLTSIHMLVSDFTGSTSSKLTTVRFPAAFLLRGAAVAFLKGSIPSVLAQAWQRNPGPGIAARVYFDWENFSH